jgi:hypothetical protein
MTNPQEKAEAALSLYEVIKTFNQSFKDWEDIYEYRANFRFKYEEKTGRKTLDISDIEPVNLAPLTRESIQRAEEVVGNALKEVTDPAFVPPELDPHGPLASRPEVHKFPELARVTETLQTELQTKVKSSIGNVLMGFLGQNDVLLLSALGIDGRAKILDVFIEVCGALKEEKYGTSRTGKWQGKVS